MTPHHSGGGTRTDEQSLTKNADAAMYLANEKGRSGLILKLRLGALAEPDKVFFRAGVSVAMGAKGQALKKPLDLNDVVGIVWADEKVHVDPLPSNGANAEPISMLGKIRL